jgi:hypothetical protein
MGLFSKSQHSKEETTPVVSDTKPNFTTAASSTTDVSSLTEFPKGSPPPYESHAPTSTNSKAPLPGHASNSNSRWPIVSHTSDYKARIAQQEANAGTEPPKKNWIKKTFNLADPSDADYYERKYTASGNGSEYEQTSQYALMASAGLLTGKYNGKNLPFGKDGDSA